MKERIKSIRKDQRLTQAEFGERIGIKDSTISSYEKGIRVPSDAIILSICKEFCVNEKWLRTGQGEPYVQKTQNEEIALFMGDLLTGSDACNARKNLHGCIPKIKKRPANNRQPFKPNCFIPNLQT